MTSLLADVKKSAKGGPSHPPPTPLAVTAGMDLYAEHMGVVD